MAISLFVVFLYGSMVWGILPIDMRLSFEGHFFGALAGVILAYFFRREGATFKKKKYQWEIEEEVEKEMEAKGYTKVTDPFSGFTVHYEYIPKEKEEGSENSPRNEEKNLLD